VTDILELLRTMADNIDATRPECDYSAAHKRIDDADIKTLRRAANMIDDYRVCFPNLAKERDDLWKDLERVTNERDEARREVCAHEADTSEDQQAYAKLRGWQCFAHTDGALEKAP
jgi:hypothetical protein